MQTTESQGSMLKSLDLSQQVIVQDAGGECRYLMNTVFLKQGLFYDSVFRPSLLLSSIVPYSYSLKFSLIIASKQ